MGDVDALPVTRRRGEAFCALLENVLDTALPTHGGTATSVMVTLDLDTLITGLGIADTSTGERITADQARRLACQARIIPVVLGKRGEVLDLGRSARLFSAAQRKAMAIRDRECTAQGCSIPAAWCEPTTHETPGPEAGRPTSPTASSSAPSTTTAPTTPPGSPTTTPTAAPPSTGGREGRGQGRDAHAMHRLADGRASSRAGAMKPLHRSHVP